MKRRKFLQAAAGGAGAGIFSGIPLFANVQEEYHNPYEAVDWTKWEVLHSMSHQHTGQSDVSREEFLSMGYRHFAFSNYYPSNPTYPLPESWTSKHPEVIAAPNAEHHSYLDVGLHANGLGSLFASGYGKGIPTSDWKSSPVECNFDDLTQWNEKRPWEGIYRIDVRSTSAAPKAEIKLTIEGAEGCDARNGFAPLGEITSQVVPIGRQDVYFRVLADVVRFKIEFDPAKITLTDLRVMQGTNRPWRDVFRAILDGEIVDGKKRGGLLYPDAGGITLNHPGGVLNTYLEMLDFDPRVLGVEIWNVRRGFGLGREKGTSIEDGTPTDPHFYRLWDQILSTGRRCWAFCVKDHKSYNRGRNVLLVPPLSSLSSDEKEATALRAYRQGSFFGSVASLSIDEEGNAIPPYDYSTFRFRRISVRRNAAGEAEAVEVEVGDQDEKRLPNIQIRFITEKGIVSIVDGGKAEFSLSERPVYVRVEAFAYPPSAKGEALTPEKFGRLDIVQISKLHDRMMKQFEGAPSATAMSPAPIVDMILSQAIRRI